MENIIAVTIAVTALSIGSFLNVVIYRLPRKLSFAKGRSFCPNCSKSLRWYHNIPILSFAFLRGKCGFCGSRISGRYPLVELLTAASYLFFYYQFGLASNFFLFSFLSSVLLVIFFIDLDFQIIPDVITLPGMVLGLAVSFLPGGIGIVNALIGLLVGGGSLYAMAILGDWLFKKDSMGGGDIKMAGMLGAFLGWQKILFIFISSATLGLVVSVIMMVFSAKLRRERIVPFGPFLAVAAFIAIVYGDQLIGLYVDNFVNIR